MREEVDRSMRMSTHIQRTLRRRIATVVGVLGLTAAALTVAPTAHADNSAPVELPRMVAADPVNHAATLQTEVTWWNVARIAEYGLNSDGADAFPPPGGWDDLSKPWTGQGSVSRTAGKLLMVYRNSVNGQYVPAACSANVITAANQSTIVAAGHCFKVTANIRGALGDDVVVNAAFIPGFNGANVPRFAGGDDSTAPAPGTDIAPYGVWGITRAWITPTWDGDSTFRSGGDVAMATVERPGDPTPIQQLTGGQNIAFNVATNPLSLYQFGYPTDNTRNWYWKRNNDGTTSANFGVDPSLRRGFDGRTLMYAHSGNTIGDSTVGIAHDMVSAMSPGSSGGPWLMNFDPATGTGTQIAVTSRFTNTTGDSPWWDAAWAIINGSTPNWAYGPYLMSNGFGDLTKTMYDVVQNTTR
ncbi:trypsin-like serine peptidase [Embleya sp. AB8]|uniref:trypsin-like serine peptidase n=1 Tax=Embleya sp. AB8 TaxID=3156304 RepID=UPI003C763C3D